MHIFVHQITDPVAFQSYFDQDGPVRDVGYFIETHTKEVGDFKAVFPPSGGDPFVFNIDGKKTEMAVLMTQWDASGEEMIARIVVAVVVDEDEGSAMS